MIEKLTDYHRYYYHHFDDDFLLHEFFIEFITLLPPIYYLSQIYYLGWMAKYYKPTNGSTTYLNGEFKHEKYCHNFSSSSSSSSSLMIKTTMNLNQMNQSISKIFAFNDSL
ncbi:hypothetical protein DERF_014909 [Dermatophagoides farinae]|uniref:Uncharacterized protein n=1 Tax=Dermatophagoides farinae TaxID=6954 RepID=A0A922KU00_DERFA|nr:hypothetical protein DERF_014909 [Dermatophagoides farinae]